MISGKSSGSGSYSYHEVHHGVSSVMVSHMPEDLFTVRIVFKTHGEICIPILKISDDTAMLLWSALKQSAIDLKWDDRMFTERLEDLAKEKK